VTENKTQIVLLALIVILAAMVAARYLLPSGIKVEGEKSSERVVAVQQVVAERPRGAGEELARATGDASQEVRAGAIAGLTHVLAPEHRPVVEKSTKDPDPRTRAVAAGTLSTYADKPAVDVLVDLVENDKEEEVVRVALRGLGRCKKDPRSIVTLLNTAEHGRSNEIKIAAMNGLLRMLGGRVSKEQGPENEKRWRDLIQRWKEEGFIQKAYAAAGAPLVQRPQDRLGKNWHATLKQKFGTSLDGPVK
jgi:HEAT repeat protein